MTIGLSTRRAVVAGLPATLGLAALARAQPVADPAAVRFLVVGDWGRDGKQGQQRVADAMKVSRDRDGSEFVVSTGDNFYNLGVGSVDDPKWQSSFERVYDPSLGTFYAVLGNHDYGGKVQAQIDRSDGKRWQMPARWHDKLFAPPGGRSVHLFFFDTVAWLGKESFPFTLFGSSMDEDLQKLQIEQMSACLAASTADVKIAFGHHPIYSIGPHGGGMRLGDLDDLLRRHKVAAYVCGHDHCLYHITHQGMHYVCSGAGSQMLASYTGGKEDGCVIDRFCHDPEGTGPFPAWHAFFAKRPGTRFDLNGGFARFELGRIEGGFTFFDGNAEPRHSARFY